MKALIEYTNRNRLRDVSSLQVTVEATALPGRAHILYINDKNRANLQTLDIPHAWGTVKVSTLPSCHRAKNFFPRGIRASVRS